ncbi:MAG: type VI secretion system baseplate subunit TssE [Pyrinomonadaceae bacterium]
MPRFDNEERVTLSVLDRLIDEHPKERDERPGSRQSSLRLFKQAMRRDLEWLLNTRQLAGGLPEGLEELRASLAAYGLPDFTGATSDEGASQTRVRAAIEDAIRSFEPRLQDVNVSLEPQRETERSLRFRIDALLMIDPAPEPVTFDTTLRLVSGAYEVEEK